MPFLAPRGGLARCSHRRFSRARNAYFVWNPESNIDRGHRHVGLPQQPAGLGDPAIVDVLRDVLAGEPVDAGYLPGRHACASRQPRQCQILVAKQFLLDQQAIDAAKDFPILLDCGRGLGGVGGATGRAFARWATIAVDPRRSNPRRFALLTISAALAPLLHAKSRRTARSRKADRQSDTAARTSARGPIRRHPDAPRRVHRGRCGRDPGRSMNIQRTTGKAPHRSARVPATGAK